MFAVIPLTPELWLVSICAGAIGAFLGGWPSLCDSHHLRRWVRRAGTQLEVRLEELERRCEALEASRQGGSAAASSSNGHQPQSVSAESASDWFEA